MTLSTREIFTTLTDMFARCAFSIEIKDKERADNHFVKILRNLVGTGEAGDFQPSLIASLTRNLLSHYKSCC